MESVLFRVVDILNTHKISYWLTDGTLLGIVRENRILPWDLDIDIAVWKSEVQKIDVIKIFEDEGFKQMVMMPNMDCIHFMIDGTEVDIGFYSDKNSEVYIKWAYPSSKKLDRLTFLFINTIFLYSNKCITSNYKKSFLNSIVQYLIELFSNLLTGKIKNRMYIYARNKYSYIGCTYPINLLDLKKIKFKDHEVIVPKDSDEYLRLTYGDNWRVPNKKYDMYEDTFNLQMYEEHE